jgi:hypothetical protein
MDLQALGEQLAARKADLMGGADGEEDTGARRSARSTQPNVMARLARRARGQ